MNMEKKEIIIKYSIIGFIVLGLILMLYLVFNGKDQSDAIFSIKSNNIEIKIGDSIPLEYELSEASSIIWKSEDDNIVKVNDGVITGVNLGKVLITGTIVKNGKTISKSCSVSTYYGDKSITLNDIFIPEGDLFITKGDSYKIPISYNPSGAYINSIDYHVVDYNVVSFDGTVIAKNIGTTTISIVVNNKITKKITVNVIDKVIEPTFSKKIDRVDISEENITLTLNETKKIEYTVEPKEAYIDNIEWISSNFKIVTVDDGILTAKSSGEATIELLINNQISKTIKVSVIVPTTGIVLKSSPKIVLRVGKNDSIRASVLPENATDKKVNYVVSGGELVVDGNGVITTYKTGSGKITIKTNDGKYQTDVSYTVNPSSGVISGDGGIWGYTSSQLKIPVRADYEFFRKLANTGKGVLNGNSYVYSDAKNKYTYDIANSTLHVGDRKILVRIYYPPGVDLSETNTFTFFGGGGDRNFQGYFNNLDKDPSQMKSSGIIILVSGYSDYQKLNGIYSTDFVKGIVDQKSGVKNTIGGYSMSGPAAGEAANSSNYDRLIIFDSYFDHAASSNNLKNKEIIIYSPVYDDMIEYTISTLNSMMNYSNVTIISNNNRIINNYKNLYLIVNPGSKMGTGHFAENITKANVFAYACS